VTTIGVIGMGKLGLPYAYTLAAAGHTVHVWDENQQVREAAEHHPAFAYEHGLRPMFDLTDIVVTPPDLIADVCELVFIVVPTPSEPDGSYRTEHVLRALAALDGKVGTIGLVSTVSPGTCRQLQTSLEARGQVLVYTPALVALGTVLTDLQAAMVWIIGAGSPEQADPVRRVLHDLSPRGLPLVMDYESAELAKLAVNVSMTTRIAFVNELARLAHLWGGNVDLITAALAAFDKRAPLVAESGFGGPCLPRDGEAYSHAGRHHAGIRMGRAAADSNTAHLHFVVDLAIERSVTATGAYRSQASTFEVIGTSYKPGVPYEIESFGCAVADELRVLGLSRVPIEDAEIVVICQPGDSLEVVDWMRGARVIDVGRWHPYLGENPRINYVPVGAPNDH
jgi:UDPglucose 6-dehydrogenase